MYNEATNVSMLYYFAHMQRESNLQNADSIYIYLKLFNDLPVFQVPNNTC